MCGILGFIVDEKDRWSHENEPHVPNKVRSLARSLLAKSQSRGSDASGIAVMKKDNRFGMLKVPKASRAFLQSTDYKDFEQKYLDENTNIMIGHCRAQTHGTWKDNRNNHPIQCGRVVGVHNGVIGNYLNLWRTEGDKDQRKGEVDSEIIFHLIDKYAKENECKIEEAIAKAGGKLSGSFACAFVHLKKPRYLWLFTRHGPIYMYSATAVGLKVFASGQKFVEEAIQRIQLLAQPSRMFKFPANKAARIDSKTGKIRLFDIERNEDGYSDDYQYWNQMCGCG